MRRKGTMQKFKTMSLLTTALMVVAVGNNCLATIERPNIVVFLTDDQGYADVGFQGYPAAEDVVTPNLNRLAGSGIAFRNGYVAFSTCSPSRASILTGRSGSRFGVEENNVPMAMDEILIPQLIRNKGYISAAIGKWHLGVDKGSDALKRGFDFRYGNDSGSGDYFMAQTRNPSCWQSAVAQPRAYGRYITDAYMDEAAHFIKNNKDRPFFLYLAFNAPHSPFRVYEEQVQKVVSERPHWKPVYERMKAEEKFPAYDFGKFKGQDLDQEILRLCYVTMLMKADEGVGKVLDVLEQEGLREKTLIFYLSDNGAALNRPNDLGGVNEPLREGKGSVYDGGVRVPYVMSWPGVLPAGAKSDLVVSSMDIFSTSVELAGAKVPTDRVIDGVNLIPYLIGKKDRPAHPNLFFRRHGRNAGSIRKGDFKWVWNPPKKSSDLKGHNYEANHEGGFYNIQKNISEDMDLSDQYSDRKKELIELYKKITDDLPKPNKATSN